MESGAIRSPGQFVSLSSHVIQRDNLKNWLCLVKFPMATEKQIAANRRNALKSTGPKSPEGKAAVRLNALRHGLRARTVVLPGEKAEDFHQLCADLEAEWQPQSCTEQLLVEQMAVAQWKLARVDACETALFDRFEGTRQIGHLDRISQMAVRHERSFFRALRELERLREDRRREARHQEHAEQAERAAQPVAGASVEPPRPSDALEHSYVMAPPAAQPAVGIDACQAVRDVLQPPGGVLA
jgi:hypothetical protein